MSERHLEHTLFGDEERQHQPEQRRREHPRPPRRRWRRGRRLLVLIVALALVAGGGYAAYGALRPMIASLTQSNDYPGPGTGSVTFVVNDGDTGRVIAKNLADKGVVKTPKAFLDAAATNPRTAGIQPGSYPLKREMTAAAALAVLVDPSSRTAGGLTIREGLRAKEIYPLLARATRTPLADYTNAVKHPAALGLPAVAKGDVEGYLFPSTYDFPANASAGEQLSIMVSKAKDELTQAGVPDAGMERTVIVASIVEAEARSEADRPKVARVIENRLAKGMHLQLDSTVSYGVGRRSVTTTKAERHDANRYNTYLYPGLPIGPIGNPGRSALDAAMHPAAGPWLYFVAVNPSTGEIRFATTATEHAANVRLFQSWCSAHRGKC